MKTPFSGIDTEDYDRSEVDYSVTRIPVTGGRATLAFTTEAGEDYTLDCDFEVGERAPGGVALLLERPHELDMSVGWMPTAPDRYRLILDLALLPDERTLQALEIRRVGPSGGRDR